MDRVAPCPLWRVWGGQAEWKRVVPRGEKQLCVSGVPSAAAAGFISHSYITSVGHNLSSRGHRVHGRECLHFMDEEYRAQLLQAHHHLSNSHRWSVEAERLFLHLKQTQIPVRSTTKVSEVWEKQTKPA